jgi:putative FmdB family regulatory protein
MKYSYRCQDCNEVTEEERRLSEMNDPFHCKCGGEGKKIIVTAPTVHLDPISGDHIGATDRWVKGRERQMKKEEKCMKNHGSYN